MGCANSKSTNTADSHGDDSNGRTNPNAPVNLKPSLSSPTNTNNTSLASIPLQSRTSNSYITGGAGPGGGAAPPSITVSIEGGGPAPPPSKENQQKVYLARYAYQARTKEDLSFEKGERLMVVGVQESDWWMAKSLKTQREGYIPRNYVAEAESYEAEE